ncbi:MAG: MFS transporter [Candidatus Promineifilaceae bacterium]
MAENAAGVRPGGARRYNRPVADANPKSIIRTYLSIVGLYNLAASLIWGVNTLFLLDAGLNIFQVFVANAAYTAGMALFEIPTGVVADTLGRRVSYLLSLGVLFVTTLGYVAAAAMGGSLGLFVALSALIGLGYTFYSGAVEAWLVDALQASGHTGSLDRVFARGQAAFSAATLIGTVAGGLLGSLSLSLPYLVRALLLAAVFGFAFASMHDIGYTRRALRPADVPAAMREIAVKGVVYGWQQRPVRLLMLFEMTIGVIMVWLYYAWQPYLLALLGRPDAVWLAGVVAALMSLAMMTGNGLVLFFMRFCGRRTTMLTYGVLAQAAGLLLVGLSGNFWLAAGGLLLFMAGYGLRTPTRQSMLHALIPSSERATIVSFGSMLDSGASIAGQLGLGRLAQTVSIPAGYVVSGLFALAGMPFLWLLGRLDLPADAIIPEEKPAPETGPGFGD